RAAGPGARQDLVDEQVSEVERGGPRQSLREIGGVAGARRADRLAQRTLRIAEPVVRIAEPGDDDLGRLRARDGADEWEMDDDPSAPHPPDRRPMDGARSSRIMPSRSEVIVVTSGGPAIAVRAGGTIRAAIAGAS